MYASSTPVDTVVVELLLEFSNYSNNPVPRHSSATEMLTPNGISPRNAHVKQSKLFSPLGQSVSRKVAKIVDVNCLHTSA